MKKQFSTAWKSSSQPRKKRKYSAKAPLHIKMKFLSSMLSKDLRKKLGKRNMKIRKGDKVKILRGEFSGKEGKITNVFPKISKVTIENIQRKKRDGSKVDVKMDSSNLQIMEINQSDRKEQPKKEMEKEKTAKSEKNKEAKK